MLSKVKSAVISIFLLTMATGAQAEYLGDLQYDYKDIYDNTLYKNSFEVTAKNNQNLCVTREKKANRLFLEKCHGGLDQRWVFKTIGFGGASNMFRMGRVISKQDNKCLYYASKIFGQPVPTAPAFTIRCEAKPGFEFILLPGSGKSTYSMVNASTNKPLYSNKLQNKEMLLIGAYSGPNSQFVLKRPLLKTPGECLDSEEAKLAKLINEYRSTKGLPNVPLSKSLSTVAQWHTYDLYKNNPDTGSDHGYECNLHSWSNMGKLWKPVCYTKDHKFSDLMFSKPSEITAGVYTNNGYEISTGGSNAYSILNSWKTSGVHDIVLLEQSAFQGAKWKAMGIGISHGIANVWFGKHPDPAGSISQCFVIQ